MRHSFDFRPWLKPALTIILGLVLVFNPGSLTTYIAWCVGLIIALIGAGRLVRYFSQGNKSVWNLLGSIVLLLLGFSILKNPVSLEKRASQIVGILLLLQAARGFMDPIATHEKTSSVVLGVAGAALVLMPLTVPRMVVVICGIVVLALGVGMALDLLHSSGSSGNSGDPDVIDAR